MSKKIEIIDVGLVYWDHFRNSWFIKQLGDASIKDIIKTANAIKKRFAFNRWDEKNQEETTAFWYDDNYRWVLTHTDDTKLTPDSAEVSKQRRKDKLRLWHQFGGPLHTLDTRKLYTMSFGGKRLVDHYDWFPVPKEIQRCGG